MIKTKTNKQTRDCHFPTVLRRHHTRSSRPKVAMYAGSDGTQSRRSSLGARKRLVAPQSIRARMRCLCPVCLEHTVHELLEIHWGRWTSIVHNNCARRCTSRCAMYSHYKFASIDGKVLIVGCLLRKCTLLEQAFAAVRVLNL
jgi:hypothetical protein